jgi:hypothetical protein
VKVARLVPCDAQPALYAGASLIVQEPGIITKRVLRLTQLAAQPDGLKLRTPFSGLELTACASGLVLAATVIVANSGLLTTVHSVMECVVSLLQ